MKAIVIKGISQIDMCLVTQCCRCDTRKWFKVEVISTVTEPVRDVAFCPNLGRSYHMLAVASKDVHIFSLKPLTRFLSFFLCIVH